jgi:hypothetical protein
MSDDAFLSRWSRRKRAATRDADHGPDAAVEPRISPDPAPDTATDRPEQAPDDAEIAALPPVESIAADTDITGFLRRGVPPLLRRAALRRRWRVNPAIRDYVDDAREYAFDWNAPGGGPGGGVVSQEEAAAIVARLFGPKPAREAASKVGQPGPPRPTSDPPPPDKAGPDPGSVEEVDAAPVAKSDAAPGGGDRAGRRHGGATPVWPPEGNA